MDIIQVIVLALVQGATEYLPISSSGHLVVTSQILGWPDQGLTFDIAVHVGTLAAVLVYFWRDVGRMAYGLVSPLLGRAGAESRLVWNVIVGTLPLVAAGYALAKVNESDPAFINQTLRDPVVIGAASIGFGIVLWLADRLAPRDATLRDMGPAGALFVGLAQVLALVPGTSRAGITITAARLLGYERTEAARFSLLLAIPAIAGAGILAGKDLMEAGDIAVTQDALIGAALSFAAALVAIWLMLAWVRRASYLPFVIYRIAFGAFLIWWFGGFGGFGGGGGGGA
ncbi:MAG: undecaprenyl-diphosphate phosphatase [Alphaproteobacteria bacterium]